MRTSLSAAILTALLASAASANSADEPAAIIEKAIKASGGEEKLAKATAKQWKAKGAMEMMGQKMTYTADYFVQQSGQMRFDIAMEISGMKISFSAATDGKIAWEKMGDMVREMEAKKAKAFHHNVYAMQLGQLLPLKGKEYTLAMADEIKIDGNDVVGVKVSRKDFADVTLYFDKKTGLLAKSATKIWNEFTDSDVNQEVFFQGWKDKDGVKIFDKLIIKRDGKTFIVEECSDFKPLEKIDPKMFAKP